MDMPKHSEKKYPQITLTREVYERLYEMKYELRQDSLAETIEKLMDEFEQKKPTQGQEAQEANENVD